MGVRVPAPKHCHVCCDGLSGFSPSCSIPLHLAHSNHQHAPAAPSPVLASLCIIATLAHSSNKPSGSAPQPPDGERCHILDVRRRRLNLLTEPARPHPLRPCRPHCAGVWAGREWPHRGGAAALCSGLLYTHRPAAGLNEPVSCCGCGPGWCL